VERKTKEEEKRGDQTERYTKAKGKKNEVNSRSRICFYLHIYRCCSMSEKTKGSGVTDADSDV